MREVRDALAETMAMAERDREDGTVLSPQSILRGSYRSVRELIARIEAFTESWNTGASPFTWVRPADEILAKAVRKRSATNEPGHQVP